MVCLAILWSSSSTSPEDGPVGEAFGGRSMVRVGGAEKLSEPCPWHTAPAPHSTPQTTPRHANKHQNSERQRMQN